MIIHEYFIQKRKFGRWTNVCKVSGEKISSNYLDFYRSIEPQYEFRLFPFLEVKNNFQGTD